MAQFNCGRFLFSSKKIAVARVKEILSREPLYKTLTGNAADLIRAVLSLHPHCAEKLAGFPLAAMAFEVRPDQHPVVSQRCFFVIRPDGTSIDFSYRVALRLVSRGPAGVPTARIEEAARRAVDRTMVAYKLSRFGTLEAIPCDATGQLLNFRDAHVDHAGEWPFSRIVREFVEIHGECVLRDCGVYHEFADARDAAAFKQFHDQHAQLRIIHKQINIALGDGSRAKKDAL